MTYDIDELSELVVDAWYDSENESIPCIYFGMYNKYLLLTINDETDIIKFMNSHGNVLMIPKNKCNVNNEIYNLNIEPHVAYTKLNDNTEIFIFDNLLNDLQLFISQNSSELL